jgi:hypothetical protein
MRTAAITVFCIFLCGCGLWQGNITGQHAAGDAMQHTAGDATQPAAGDVTQHAAEDDAKCVSYGAKRGDATYVQCRVQLDAARSQAAALAASKPPVVASAPAAAASTSGFAGWLSAFTAPSPSIHNNEIPANYRELVRSTLESSLLDPYSVRDAQIAAPAPMWVGLSEGGKVPTVCVRLNAKTASGAYSGIVNYTFLFQDGAAVPIAHTPYGCGQVAYQPFTEMNGETSRTEANSSPMGVLPR